EPAQFWYDAFKYSKKSDDSLFFAEKRAINPEKEILAKDLAISKSNAHQKTSDLLYGIGQVLTLAGSFTDSTEAQHLETEVNLQNNAAWHRANNHRKAL